MKDNGTVFLGFLAGIAIGATLGVLFAPDKGSATRAKIAKKGHDVADGLEDKYNQVVESLTQKFDDLKAETAQTMKNGQQRAENAMSDAANAAKSRQ